MKKNRMMRLASILLVATLMSTCTISGTFAKYVTSAEGTDSARVAKWGVGIVAQAQTFSTTYAKDDGSFTLAANSVVSTDKVVAPGTKGDMSTIALAGIPEVACRVSYVGTLDINDKWVDKDSNFYCPIVITVKTTDADHNPVDKTFDGATYASATLFENAVNEYITAYTKDYVAGTNLAEQGADNLAISWAWPFTTGDANDVKDTFLGDAAAADVANAGTISLTVKTTVTQID